MLRVLRFREWSDTKQILAWTFVICHCPAISTNLLKTLAVWCLIGLALSLGFITNDVSDTVVDKKAGRVIPGDSRKKVKVAFFFLIIACGIAFYLGNTTALMLTLISATIGGFYSIKPIRFKERGFLGVIVGAVGQRILPVVPLMPNVMLWDVSSVCLLAMILVGIRGMILHQIKDYANDQRSDTRTWVTAIGVERAKIYLKFLLPMEILLWMYWTYLYKIPEAGLLIIFLYILGSREEEILMRESTSTLSFIYYLVLPILGIYCNTNVGSVDKIILIMIVLASQRYFVRKLIAKKNYNK